MEVGKIKQVPLREIWKREDSDFTVWLEKNIDYLNDVLYFEVTIEEREKERHGCCCAGCSLRAELWVAFAVDVLTLAAMAKELPLLPEAKLLELSKFAQIFKMNFPTLYEICANSSKLRFDKSFKPSLEDSKKSDEI